MERPEALDLPSPALAASWQAQIQRMTNDSLRSRDGSGGGGLPVKGFSPLATKSRTHNVTV
jgi:hypothetical protein